MADAFDIMQIAKKQGAAARNLEAWNKWQDELEAWQRKKAKGSFFGNLLGIGANFLTKAILPVAAGGSILDMVTRTLGRGAIGNTLSELAYNITKPKKGAPTFKGGDKSIYGRTTAKKIETEGKRIKKDIKEQEKASRRGRMFNSFLSAIMPEIEAHGGLKEFGKKLGKGDIKIFSKEQDKSIADFFKKLGGKAEVTDFATQDMDVSSLMTSGMDMPSTEVLKQFSDPKLQQQLLFESLPEKVINEEFSKLIPEKLEKSFMGDMWSGGTSDFYTKPASYLESLVKQYTTPRQSHMSVSPYGRYSQLPYGKGVPSLSKREKTMLEYFLGGK